MEYAEICQQCRKPWKYTKKDHKFCFWVGRDPIQGVSHHRYIVCLKCGFRGEIESDYHKVVAEAFDAYFRSKIDLSKEEVDRFLRAIRKLVRRVHKNTMESESFMFWLRGRKPIKETSLIQGVKRK